MVLLGVYNKYRDVQEIIDIGVFVARSASDSKAER